MNNRYLAIVQERPTWGWGMGLFPVIDGMKSIDNHYLLLALNFGIYTLASMVLILLWMPMRLFRFGLRNSRDDPTTSLAVTLMGIFVVYIISIYTVWLGAQTQPMLFLVAGWSEALLVFHSPMMKTKVPLPVQRVTYQFERVMV
jgi:hypothetical protein